MIKKSVNALGNKKDVIMRLQQRLTKIKNNIKTSKDFSLKLYV